MPQVPLFVSSAGEATQNGSTTIRFQQPLEIPAGAKDATVHVSSAVIPYTMPNVTAETNTLVVVLPKQVAARLALGLCLVAHARAEAKTGGAHIGEIHQPHRRNPSAA